MKKIRRTVISMALAAGMLLNCLPIGAAAGQFTDIKGHWAQRSMEQANADGLLNGTSTTTMSPNSTMTKAQAVTVLCRILQVRSQGDASSLNIPPNAWYAQDAAKGVSIGLLTSSDAGTLTEPLTRGEAFVLFGKAFQNIPASPDLSVLDGFADGPYLTGETRDAAAYLAGSGVVNGIDGQLKVDRPLTRAEFVTILYRLADQYAKASEFERMTGTGAVLSGAVDWNGLTVGQVLFDQTASRIRLTDTNAAHAVVRSGQLEQLELSGSTNIGRLTLASSSGDLSLTTPDTVSLDTLNVGDGNGAITFSGAVSHAEITGDSRTVTINSDLTSLTISGDGNTVTLGEGTITGDITITGKHNTVLLDGEAGSLQLAGPGNAVQGDGLVDKVDLNTKDYTLSVSHGAVTPWTNYDISQVRVLLEYPETLPAGETLQAVAKLTFPAEDRGKLCTGTWYLNGVAVEQAPVILGRGNPVSDISIEYGHDFSPDATLRYVLSYQNSDGERSEQSDSGALTLENFSDLGLADASLKINAPSSLPPGQTLRATASVDTVEQGKICTAYWYVDGKEVSSGPMTLGKDHAAMEYTYHYGYWMPQTSEITCKVTYTTDDGRQQEISDTVTVRLENYPDNGIDTAFTTLNAPAVLPAGKTLDVSANVSFPQASKGKSCTGTWYVDGKAVSTQTVVLGTDVPLLLHTYTYTEDMKLTSDIKFVLSYTTADGRQQEISASATVNLQNYEYSYYHGPTPEEALRTVTSSYAGNYTLAWALNNDYSKEMKTVWVNAKGYSSKSKYLIWINLTYQRVNIFEGSQGNWTLIRECLCGSGKPSTPTVKGVFATTYKQNAWSYGSYYCGPVVRFYKGYAFHSRLEYWPMGSGRYYDARIGFPISHGCIRMYDDDIWWIYNNIPNGTTVVVH